MPDTTVLWVLYLLIGSVLASATVVASGKREIDRQLILATTTITLFWLPISILIAFGMSAGILLERIRGRRG